MDTHTSLDTTRNTNAPSPRAVAAGSRELPAVAAGRRPRGAAAGPTGGTRDAAGASPLALLQGGMLRAQARRRVETSARTTGNTTATTLVAAAKRSGEDDSDHDNNGEYVHRVDDAKLDESVKRGIDEYDELVNPVVNPVVKTADGTGDGSGTTNSSDDGAISEEE